MSPLKIKQSGHCGSQVTVKERKNTIHRSY